jgi:nucleoside-diphosphate-sugar epimerase
VKRALVTGGGGFLGSYICRDLRARGVEVVSLQRGDYPALAAMGVTTVRGDIADADSAMRAAEGCDTVFHVAAKAGVWGSYESYRVANIVGTERVLAACAALFSACAMPCCAAAWRLVREARPGHRY